MYLALASFHSVRNHTLRASRGSGGCMRFILPLFSILLCVAFQKGGGSIKEITMTSQLESIPNWTLGWADLKYKDGISCCLLTQRGLPQEPSPLIPWKSETGSSMLWTTLDVHLCPCSNCLLRCCLDRLCEWLLTALCNCQMSVASLHRWTDPMLPLV